ncbi:MAG: hypothetical protein IPN90_04255 [Elusimicrobia bacterium]|nr:hypothetical protein [Elusimicrobiota bacterium]
MKASMGNILRELMDNPRYAKDAMKVELFLEAFESKSQRSARSMLEGEQSPELSIRALQKTYEQYQKELQTWVGEANLRKGLTSEGVDLLKALVKRAQTGKMEFAPGKVAPPGDPTRGLYGSLGLGDFANRFRSSVLQSDIPLWKRPA